MRLSREASLLLVGRAAFSSLAPAAKACEPAERSGETIGESLHFIGPMCWMVLVSLLLSSSYNEFELAAKY